MIGNIDIKLNAHNPSFPVHALVAVVGSPSTIRIDGVPAPLGTWKLERIDTEVMYPD